MVIIAVKQLTYLSLHSCFCEQSPWSCLWGWTLGSVPRRRHRGRGSFCLHNTTSQHIMHMPLLGGIWGCYSHLRKVRMCK